MESLTLIASWAFAVIGSFFLLTGSIGLLRMPDFYTRVHASSLVDSLGALFILLALTLHFGWSTATIKIVMIVLLVLITVPTATHAMCKAARHHDSDETSET